MASSNYLDKEFDPAPTGQRDGLVARAAAGVHGTVDNATQAAEEAARTLKPVVDRAAAAAHQAVDTAARSAIPTAQWLTAKGGDINAWRKLRVDDTCKLVAAHPIKSIGIALAVGLLIGRTTR